MATRTSAKTLWISAAGFLSGILVCLPAPAAQGDAKRGKETYEKNCAQCHGEEGGGDGPASQFMLPRPRVFKESNIYKFRTTPSDALPTDQDIFKIITRGIPGTAMPSFASLAESDRWNLVAFVESLAEEFKDPNELKDAKSLPEIEKPPSRPDANAASIAQGKQLFDKNQCWKCHGQSGRGNGPSWGELKDTWSAPILPANLTNSESYRGGAEPSDIYRTFSTGLRGTPMPEYRSAMKPEERWHLVNFILSLHQRPAADPGSKIVARRVTKLPATDDDAAWKAATPVRLRTLPNVIEPPRLFWQSVEFLTVQALYTNNAIALRVQWDDRTESKGSNLDKVYEDRDGSIYKGTDHPDQLAIQLPARFQEKVRPYILFGDRKREAALWWWRADQNTFSEINAKGYGDFTPQPAESQGLTGRVSYQDGHYTLVVRRARKTRDKKHDPQFLAGGFMPILFNVWDGDRGEVGTRRALTAWYWLYLEAGVPTDAYAAPPIAFVLTLGLLLGVVYRTRKRSGAKA
ncbi:MAG TPA: c-type cytochrome [Polyangiaceae bacterium]